MFVHHHPLPQRAGQQQWGKGQIHQFLRDKDDAEGDDHESHKHQGRVNSEGTLNLVAAYAQQQRNQDYAQQPRIFNQQFTGHQDKVLAQRGMQQSQDSSKGDGCGGHNHTGALLDKLLCVESLGQQFEHQQVE